MSKLGQLIDDNHSLLLVFYNEIDNKRIRYPI